MLLAKKASPFLLSSSVRISFILNNNLLITPAFTPVHPSELAPVSQDENNQPLYFLAQIVDISQQKKAEYLLKKTFSEEKHLLELSNDQNVRLKNFAHIVSHNLRSHSGNLTMLLDLYVSENPEAAEDEIITHLISASLNLRKTITHLSEVVVMNTSINNKLEKLTFLILLNVQKKM